MPGQGCPRGPLCLPRNKFAPAQWPGKSVRCALIAALALISLLVPSSSVHGQQRQINNGLFQNKSGQREGFSTRRDSVLNSRGSARRIQRRSQPYPALARRRLFAVRRSESEQVADHPRLAEVIKSRDSLRLVEGDWQAMTFEHYNAGVLQDFGRLSDRQFRDVPHVAFPNLESLPLAVRQSQAGQQLYFYLANASPWRLRVRMQLSADASEETIKSIKSSFQNKYDLTSKAVDDKEIIVDVAPYDLIGRSARTSGLVESYSFEYLDDVASEMRKRVFALQVKLQQAQQAGALRILSNPKFLANESRKSNGQPIPGWETGQQTPSRFQLFSNIVTPKANTEQQYKSADTNEKLMGTYLQIRSTADEVTWIRSQSITPTETGRLSISVWLRVLGEASAETDSLPEVRMAIDGQTPSDDYYRFGVVGAESADSPISLGGRWKRFAVHFDELPSNLMDLRIGFDVVGRGVVQVSQVELYDRWFDNGDAKRITQLLASADAMLRNPAHFDRCRRLLAEPWAVFLDNHFLLKPVARSAQQPVPMFRLKMTEAKISKQKNGAAKVGQSLKR